MAVVLLVAMISVHLPYGFSSVKLVGISASGARFGPVGYEIDLLYLAVLFMLAVRGPGPLALDNVLRGRRTRDSHRAKNKVLRTFSHPAQSGSDK
jgi:putative oxidoreductase